MIIISTGNLGSGKTLCEVRNMAKDRTKVHYYSNIITKNIPKNTTLTQDMIIKKELKEIKKKRDGSEQPIYKYDVNLEFWQDVKKPVSILIDEAHELFDSRTSMSKRSIIATRFIAMLRRAVQDKETGYSGELILISQSPDKLDNRIRNLCNCIRHHQCRYIKNCKNCTTSWMEHSDMPEILKYCPNCNSPEFWKSDFTVNIKYFSSLPDYEVFMVFGQRSFYKEIEVTDVESYFNAYDTLQTETFFDVVA